MDSESDIMAQDNGLSNTSAEECTLDYITIYNKYDNIYADILDNFMIYSQDISFPFKNIGEYMRSVSEEVYGDKYYIENYDANYVMFRTEHISNFRIESIRVID